MRARPTELLSVENQLTFLQLDPTAAVAPSADLVGWTLSWPRWRPGSGWRSAVRDLNQPAAARLLAGRQGLEPRPSVLETDALPVELSP